MNFLNHSSRYFLCAFCFLLLNKTKGQTLSFQHLNTSNGLSENNAQCLAIDKNGFLWIGTANGLDIYDGYNVTTYYKSLHAVLPSDTIHHLMRDSRNRIWIISPRGVAWADAEKNFHPVQLPVEGIFFTCHIILESSTYGVILFTPKGHYYFNEKNNAWEKIDWLSRLITNKEFNTARSFNRDQGIYVFENEVLVIDYNLQKIIFAKSIPNAVTACAFSGQEMAVATRSGLLEIMNLVSKREVRIFHLSDSLTVQNTDIRVSEMSKASNGNLVLSTGKAGLVMVDSAHGIVSQYLHDPLDPTSISNNMLYRVLTADNGDIITASTSSGVSICNINDRKAAYQKIFRDREGNVFDGHLSGIDEDKNHVIWLSAVDRLVRWDRTNNESAFYQYSYPDGGRGFRNLEMRTLCIDKRGRIWVGTIGAGVVLFNQKSKTFQLISKDTSLGKAVRSTYVNDLMEDTEGNIWACTYGGLYTIHPDSYQITVYQNHPLLKEVAEKVIISLFEDEQKRIWIGTQRYGIYCYDKKKNQLINYTTRNGLLDNTGYSIISDKRGNIYVASGVGFSIIAPDGSISRFSRENGMRYNRCESIIPDNEGNIWIANNKCLVKFSPGKNNLEYFEENAGISMDGFRYGAAYKASDGSLYWGTHHGINYFHPAQIKNQIAQLRVSIYQVALPDSVLSFDSSHNIQTPYSDNSVQFHFTAINLTGSKNISYQYKLEGFDRHWQTVNDNRPARYPSLPPGKYTFKVKASIDRINWTDAKNEVRIEIVPPLWKKWWFVAGYILLLAGGSYWFLQNRKRKIRRQREELETEQAINYFASSIYDQQSVDTILWDVARNCIGRLQIQDCVIYLLDTERNVLVQKAAHGPKNPKQHDINKPIEIPLGHGIVGSVAITGKGEIIPDTTKDVRYIVDDEHRYSEISMPIISDGKVLGVIDCEHSKKAFFTQKHFSILTTIASLCANKIVRAKAEEEKQMAQSKLIDTQHKMTEIEMQALRAQMNPHFIFNCLNSINRYIVKSDQATASLYLTKFAKLIRLILDNSNNKNVILTNELEALKLYIEMEALRFDKKFTYHIMVDPNVNADSIEVPPLIIQPYVENAIWHGLLHKEAPGCLRISVSLPEDNMLQCIIEDDGVGRQKAKELKSKSATTRKSLGLKLTEDRLTLLNKYAELNTSIEIIDLSNGNGEAAGTKVILKIPV